MAGSRWISTAALALTCPLLRRCVLHALHQRLHGGRERRAPGPEECAEEQKKEMQQKYSETSFILKYSGSREAAVFVSVLAGQAAVSSVV